MKIQNTHKIISSTHTLNVNNVLCFFSQLTLLYAHAVCFCCWKKYSNENHELWKQLYCVAGIVHSQRQKLFIRCMNTNRQIHPEPVEIKMVFFFFSSFHSFLVHFFFYPHLNNTWDSESLEATCVVVQSRCKNQSFNAKTFEANKFKLSPGKSEKKWNLENVIVRGEKEKFFWQKNFGWFSYLINRTLSI